MSDVSCGGREEKRKDRTYPDHGKGGNPNLRCVGAVVHDFEEDEDEEHE